MRRHSVLIICGGLSLLLLASFLFIGHVAPPLLNLELKWLIVVGVPVLIGLLAGNYIKNFKGLGIEVEALLQNPIGAAGMVVADAVESIPGGKKSSLDALQRMPPDEKARYRRLTFVKGRKGYYDETAVGEYLRALTHIEFIEITDEAQKFVALIPLRPFRNAFDADTGFRTQFVNAVAEEGAVGFAELFGHHYITEAVSDSDPLVKVARKVRHSPHELLPVVDADRKLLGVVTARIVERRITDEVLSARA